MPESDPHTPLDAVNLSRRIHNVIDQALSEVGGGMATGFIGLVHYVGKDGSNYWSFVAMEGQTITQSLGMNQIMAAITHNEMNQALFKCTCGEDDCNG